MPPSTKTKEELTSEEAMIVTTQSTTMTSASEPSVQEILNDIEQGGTSAISNFMETSRRSRADAVIKSIVSNQKKMNATSSVGDADSISMDDLAGGSSSSSLHHKRTTSSGGGGYDDYDDDDDDDSMNMKDSRHSTTRSTSFTDGDNLTAQSNNKISEEILYEEQTMLVVKMKRRFYRMTLLAAIIGFLMTYFLNKRELQQQVTLNEDYDDDEGSKHHTGWYAIITPMLMILTSFSMFYYYEKVVEERHYLISMNAQRTSHIVSSLFPKNIQHRIWAEDVANENSNIRIPKLLASGGGGMSGGDDDKNGNNKKNKSKKSSSGGGGGAGGGGSRYGGSGGGSTTRLMAEFLDDDERDSSTGLSKQRGGNNNNNNNDSNNKKSSNNNNKKSSNNNKGSGSSPLQETAASSSRQQPKTKPIADLFPEATIFFGDLVGFTAWSSMREPSQVFMLLEAIYGEFDEIARRRRVFKVETVGDCYVAVAGLPEPCINHAQVMARFAWDCRLKMNGLVKELEVLLGPDTADLAIRIGLHSGPVTAGVLRGDRARFQLFGDTVNTTSRIETTGKQDKIHVSQECAQLLSSCGKDHWLTQREDKVTAKGKGELSTYWLRIGSNRQRRSGTDPGSSMHSGEDRLISSVGGRRTSTTSSDDQSIIGLDGDDGSQRSASNNDHNNSSNMNILDDQLSEKHERLVNWITNELAILLKEIQIQRMGLNARKNKTTTSGGGSYSDGGGSSSTKPGLSMIQEVLELERASTTTDHEGAKPLDEVQEIVTLPKFENTMHEFQLISREKFELSADVLTELHTYVHTLATMYPDNPFHNFEHASHVTMSVVKLLSRIVRPSDINVTDTMNVASTLHDHTYGITSDPLTQFSVVLSGLVHDIDHPGVPNSQLIKEKPRLAEFYKNKSMAEQNSVDLSWALLMDDGFTNLRAAIYGTPAEFKRFRSLIVNSVMATDIMDKDLSAARKERWAKAFSESNDIMAIAEEGKENEHDDINRKATIVIEHIIQASDIAHTMQHWHIYRKWNGRLFEEMYKAYIDGRAETNPADNWYEGEIGFFKFYIIPLAHKLKECGVFGVSGDEYLNYAVQNLREWELNGKNVVSSMVGAMKYQKQPSVSKPASVEKRASLGMSSGNQIGNGANAVQTNAETTLKPMPPKPIQRVANAKMVKEMIKNAAPSVGSQNPKEGGKALKELPENMSLLFVDDDKIARKLFARTIKKMNPQWVVKEAASGEEAIELLKSSDITFDLIFMDYIMGTDDKQLLGSATVSLLRKEIGITSKVCGMSANDVEDMFHDAGADEFIFKPLRFRPQALTQELLRILSAEDDWGVVPLSQVPVSKKLILAN